MKAFLKPLFIFIIFLSFFTSLRCYCKEPKIVGLIPVRNEEAIINQTLQALAVYTDALIVLDDASTDRTLEIIELLQDSCNIEKIIHKEIWIRDERGDKQKLLEEGRKIGGTHFIVMDADNIFTACCAKDDWLRKKILSLKPGQILSFQEINLWGGFDFYRNDSGCGVPQGIYAVFCDDGRCDYNHNRIWGYSGVIHVEKWPENLQKVQVIPIKDVNYGILHLKWVNLQSIGTRHVWYKCFEYIKRNEREGKNANYAKNANAINRFYSKEAGNLYADSSHLFKKASSDWYNYNFFDRSIYTDMSASLKKDITNWFQLYGLDYFKLLDIWRDPWVKQLCAKLSKEEDNRS